MYLGSSSRVQLTESKNFTPPLHNLLNFLSLNVQRKTWSFLHIVAHTLLQAPIFCLSGSSAPPFSLFQLHTHPYYE